MNGKRVRRIAGAAGAAALLVGASPVSSPAPSIQGFSEPSARSEARWEEAFRKIPDTAILRENMRRLSARPHHVGSPYDRENAEWILAQFRKWGWEAAIEKFEVLFPTPKERRLEMIEPGRFTAKLEEPAVAGDPTSAQRSEQLPTYNAYSVDGDVTAAVVYVNFGVPADYEELDRLGISVEGKIVIARYFGSWRGIKPKVAAEHGAVGCIIYSDPHEDGYFEGDVFPNGAYRPPEGVQRGSVADMPLYPGDPETPGTGSVPGAARLPLSKAKTLTRIPVLPISYADAEPLLRGLGGPIAPEAWRGALAFPYHVGPGATKVHMVVRSNWNVEPIYDVIARIPGSAAPDQWVIRGNHQDAWVNGADDPISGLSPLLEEARALGQLRRAGWRPKRTIVYCAWDGEEPGLLGSTEWAETHADELRKKAVAYLNTDNNGPGYFTPSATHTLQLFVDGVARSVTDPESGLSAARRALFRDERNAKTPEEADKVRQRPDMPVSALGSGSDYTVFLDFLGIPSMDFRFGGEDGGGVYHSIYDDFYWYTHFSDTDFAYGRALAQACGTAVVRLANADLLPYDFRDFSREISKSTDELEKLASETRAKILERNRQIAEGVFAATSDPRRPERGPKIEDVPPHLNFSPLEVAVVELDDASRRYSDAASASAAPAALEEANRRLMHVERALLDEKGLPGRPWFRNQVYAPGFYTGYGVKTIPGVREAIEQKQWKLAGEEIGIAARTLRNAAAAIREAASAFHGDAR